MMIDADPAAVLNDLYDRPGFLFRRAHQIFAALFADTCRRLDLTQSQYGVLRLLKYIGSADQTTVALMLGHDRSTVGLVVSNLVNRGAILRKPDSRDRRRNLLVLTTEGLALVDAAVPLAAQAHQEVFSPLDQEEQAALMASLRKLTSFFSDDTRVPMDRP